jgi:hypothetical protein
MIISCLLPIAIVASFGVAAPPVSRRVPPRLAIWMLSAGGLALTVCAVVAISVVVAFGIGQLAPLARLGHWSPRMVGVSVPFHGSSIGAAAVLLVLAVGRGASTSWTHGRRLLAAWSASRAAPAGLVVLNDDEPFAYAVPGWPGRIVVSRGLLRGLDPLTRRAVLAHEQTHLTERHDLHYLAAAVAAVVNPFLVRSPAALDLACERRADEVAARTVDDRRSVVRAITAAVRPQAATMFWAASGADVPRRVAALLNPADDNRMVATALLAATIVAVAVSAASVLWLGHDLRSVLIMARN